MSGYEIHVGAKDKPLFIVFGGLSLKIGMPPFEFKTFLKKNFGDINYVFIRDVKQFWYFNGIVDLSNNHDETIIELEKIINEIKHNKLIFVGNSMGAYAAILYGIHLNVPNIMAFSPQTFIDSENREIFSDNRWEEIISKINEENLHSEYLNLKNFKNISNNSKIELFYGKHEYVDKKHANNVSDYYDINITEVDGMYHNVIRLLKNNGELLKIINKLL